MFTLIMMILSSLVTLYFARPGFKKAVNYFFSTSDKPGQSTTKDGDQEIPTLDQPVRRERDLGWRAWNKEDEAEQEWTEEDEEADGQRSR